MNIFKKITKLFSSPSSLAPIPIGENKEVDGLGNLHTASQLKELADIYKFNESLTWDPDNWVNENIKKILYYMHTLAVAGGTSFTIRENYLDRVINWPPGKYEESCLNRLAERLEELGYKVNRRLENNRRMLEVDWYGG